MEPRIEDAMQEIGNVGAAHAVTALSQLMERTVMISVPRVKLARPSEVGALTGQPDTLMAGTQFHVVGDASARILMMLSRGGAMELVDLLLRNAPGTTKTLNELGNSTVREVGNIMASAYLNGLSEFLAMLLLPSVPNLIFDIAGAILEQTASGVELRDGYLMAVEVTFEAKETGVKGHLILMVDASSIEPMATAAETVVR